MKVKSIKKNVFYNTILTVVNMLFPLITAPYLSYVLGAENIGKVNYATAIVGWFILFASFGIPRYGIREIARKRDDKRALSNAFWNLLLIQSVLSFITIIVYMIVILNLPIFKNEMPLYVAMLLMIVLNIFSIDWFYQGIEEYGFITIRNVIVKIVSIILIFVFIHEREHYLLYAGINILGLSFNNILNYLHIKKYVDKKINQFEISHYLKVLRVYFMTTFIIALYTQLDQIFLGSKSQRDLAYYIRSKMVLSVGIGIVNALITVYIPRTAYLKEHNYTDYKKVINQFINYIYVLAIPCVVGIILLSDEVMFILGGEEFLPAGISLQIISAIVLITSIGAWQVNQILIPYKLENVAFYLQCSAAALSIILNIILIPKYSYVGTAVAWVIVEFFLLVAESIVIKYMCKDIKIKYFNISLGKYCLAVLLMAAGIIGIKTLIQHDLISIVLSLSISPIIYFGILIILKEKLINELSQGIFKKSRKSSN